MRRAYEVLLLLYPRDYRRLFGGEMVAVFEQGAAEQGERGRAAFLRFAAKEMGDLLAGAGAEWISKLTSSSAYIKERRGADQRLAAEEGVNDSSAAQQRLELLLRRMEYAIAHHQFQKARWYSDLEQIERAKLRELQERYRVAE
jgi:hypothetical protein